MAYVPNGIERSLKVTITKKLGGVVVQGYPKTYDGQLAFPGYSALTDTQMQQLSDAAFTTRYNAFVNYVESIEGGVDFNYDIVGDGATRSSAACLVVTTTTTQVPNMAVTLYNSDYDPTQNFTNAGSFSFFTSGTGLLNQVYFIGGIVQNNGQNTLSVGAITISDDVNGLFSVNTTAFPNTLAYQQYYGFSIEFAGAPLAGTYTCTINIPHNDPSQVTPFRIYLSVAVS